MAIIQKTESLQANGARTSDWIGRIKGGVIYAYDLGSLASNGVGTISFTKEDFEHALKKVGRKIKK